MRILPQGFFGAIGDRSSSGLVYEVRNVFFFLIPVAVQVSFTLRVVGLVCSFLGLLFVFVGNALARVEALCRDASTPAHDISVEDGPPLYDGVDLGAPVWFSDVKPGLPSSTSMVVKEG